MRLLNLKLSIQEIRGPGRRRTLEHPSGKQNQRRKLSGIVNGTEPKGQIYL